MTGGSLCGGAAFTGTVVFFFFFSILSWFLWSLGFCTLSGFAQGFPKLLVFSQWAIRWENALCFFTNELLQIESLFCFDGSETSIEYGPDKIVVSVSKTGPMRTLSFKAHTNSEF